MLRLVLLACTLLSWCKADLTFGATNAMLDPNRITWWRTKWAPAPITLSSNNRGVSGSATFYFTLTTPITTGVLEVTFPTGFALATGDGVNGLVKYMGISNYVSGNDYSLTFSGVTNPTTSGSYGPFALKTRFYATGQQVDVNLNFGCVFIYPDAGALGSLSVTVVGAANTGTVINKSALTLSFKFNMNQSLWKYDTFVVSIDSRWTVATGTACLAADSTGKVNNFNGTQISNPHALQCVVTTQTTPAIAQQVYIYGLAVDGLDTTISDNQSIDLRIGSVTSPNSVYSLAYTWSVSSVRFGTTTTLETVSSTVGPLVTNDVISTVSWLPTWNAPTTDIVNGQFLFMDLIFKTNNAIPAGGYITITVTENLQDTGLLTGWATSTVTDNCYIATYLSRTADCTVTQKEYTLSGLPLIAAQTEIKIRSVVSIVSTTTNVAVSAVRTFQSSTAGATTAGYAIDVSSSQTGFALASSTNVVKAGYFNWFYHTGTTTSDQAGGEYDALGTLLDYKLQFAINTSPSSIDGTSAFRIECPFTSVVDDFGIGLSSSLAYTFKSDTIASVAGGVVGAPTLTLSATPSYTAGSSTAIGSITFAGAHATPSYNVVQVLDINKGTGANIQLPRVATNFATYYECRAAVTISSTLKYTAFVRLGITVQDWQTAEVKVPCLAASDGLPLMININPVVPFISASNPTFYVEVELLAAYGSSAFSSGITPITTAIATSRLHEPLNTASAVEYPFAKPSGTTISSAKLYITPTKAVFAFTGFGQLAKATSGTVAASFYFPIGGFTADVNPSVVIRSVYYLTTDQRYKHITHESASISIGALIFADAGWTTPALASATVSGVNGSPISTLGLNIYVAAATAGGAWFFVVLPRGWQLPSTVTVKLGASSVLNNYIFTSANPTFAYPGILFSNQISATPTYSDTPTATSATDGTLSISGSITLALGIPSAYSFRVAAGTATGAAAAPVVSGACKGNKAVTTGFTVNAGTIGVTVTPLQLKERGPDGINISETVTIVPIHSIPLGGSINFTFNSLWVPGYTSTTCSYCTASGVTIATGTGNVPCQLSGNTVTVKGFASVTAGTSITVTIYGLMSPVSVTSGTTTISFVDTLTTSTDGTVVIDRYTYGTATSTTGNAVTVTAGTSKGASTMIAKKTYPSNAGTTGVDMYVKFSVPHPLPACGKITITNPLGFKTSGDIKDKCFFSLKYEKCELTSSAVVLTITEAYTGGNAVELYLDGLVDNPNTATATSSGFQITTSWGESTVVKNVDEDSTTAPSTHILTPDPILATSITGANTPISFSPKNAGEMATYVFDFKDTANFAATDQYWIVFPASYDYFLGNTWAWHNNEPGVYYIECSSTQLGTTWCQVDHNIVIVTGSNAITGSTQIVITINNICNPTSVQTDAFQIYHVDTTGKFITVQQKFGTVTPSVLAPNNIYVRSVAKSENRLFKSSDYTWRLYMIDTMSTDSQLQVLFPQEYNLRLFDKKDSYSCTSTWLDISATSTNKNQQTWNSASSCSASNNLVSMSSPTAATTFSMSSIVTLNVQSVGNPQFGQTRFAATYINTMDFDVTDSVLWPLWTYWSSKFTFFVYHTTATSLAYTARSYPNMNAAYANFYDGYRPILVNGYSPQSKTGRITVFAGTQTGDVYITTESLAKPMAAKQIVFTPTTNSRTPDGGKLKYTSNQDSWTLFQSFYSIQFRVCASIDTTKGLYYIDWSNNETKQTGLSDVQYDIPASTMVEVVGKTASKYTFGVSIIPNVSTGFTSVPIKVSISNAPCSDVSVNIAVSGTPANISVTPTALVFGPDVNTRYFQIQVASNYDITLGTVQTLTFTLSGTDAYAYSIAASTKFTITQPATTLIPGSIVSWGLGQPTKTAITVSPSSDQIGVIYYQLAALGTAVPSFSTLKSSVTALINQNGTTGGTGKDEGANSESDPQTGETWEEFQRRLLKQHLQTQWSGSISMYATTAVSSLSFTWLWAATQYQISGYLDNLSTSSTTPTVRTEPFTTLAIADSQPVALKFTGSVSPSFSSKIVTMYAGVIGVNPTRLLTPSTNAVVNNRRALADTTSTTFNYILLVNRYSESPSPTDQAKVSATALTDLSARLITEGGLPTTATLNSITNTAIQSRITPTWTTVPASGGSTVNSVTANLKSSTAGRTCCVALTGSSTAPSAEQVMLNLDATNTAASGTCITTDLTSTSNSVQISSLQASTAYYVYCTATDTYPLWPTYMSYSTSSPLTPVSITTLNSGEVVVTGASYLGGLLALLALLFN